MESLMTSAGELLTLVEMYLLELSVVLLGLAGIAKLTKTETDNKYVNKAKELVEKALSFVKKLNPLSK